jgi:hypothetical protein
MSAFQQGKMFLIDHLHLAKDALHIYVGMIIFLGALLLMRWRARDWKPFLVALLAALAGEAWDLRDSVTFNSPINLWANWHDIWNTCFWPLMIVTLARFTKVFGRN